MTRCPSPTTSVVCAPVITVTFARLISLRVNTASARSCGSIDEGDVADEAGKIDRGFDAGIPPPTTATRLPLNSGHRVRTIGDAAVAIFALPGTLIHASVHRLQSPRPRLERGSAAQAYFDEFAGNQGFGALQILTSTS